MRCRMLFTYGCSPELPAEVVTVENGKYYIEAGKEFDGPDTWKLVVGGHAEAADDECRERVALEMAKPNTVAGVGRQAHARIMETQREFIDEFDAEEDDEE